MAVDPNNPNVVYVGTPQNGLFVTSDGGATWQSVSAVPVGQSDGNGTAVDDYPGITGIEFDPALGVTGGKTNTIFAASYGNGVYESTNAGVSWSAIGGPSNVESAAVSSTGVYYVVRQRDLLWSFQNGAWAQLLSDTNGIQSVAVDPFNPNEIVAQTPAGYLNISYNGGATWSGDSYYSQLNSTDVPWLAGADGTGSVKFMSIAATEFDQLVPNKLWSTDGVGVWNTTLPTSNFQWDTVVTWNDQSAGIEQLVANEVIVPPGGDPVVASWDRAFFELTNLNAYPSTYGPVNGAFAAGWSLDYASSNPSFIVGLADWWGTEETGYSTNGGQTWTPFPTFIPGAGGNFIGGTIAASTPENIIWAPADNQQPYYTLDGGQTWNPITLPGVSNWNNFDLAYYLDIRTVTADRVLPNTFYLYDQGVYETTNGGVSWTEVHGQVSASDGDLQLQSVPGEAGNLFYSGGYMYGSAPVGFYQSTNQGATWTAVANVEGVTAFGFGAPAPGQSYPSIYIVGDVNNVYGIWQSNDDAHSWVQIGTYPNSSIASITTISGDPNTYGQVYVGFSGDGFAYLPAAGTTSGAPGSASPQVLSIAETPATGHFDAGKTVTFTLDLSEAVTVAGGTPTLTLNDGGTATYSGGSSTDALTFSYTVGAGQNTAALAATAVNLTSATSTDGAGDAASLSLSGLTQNGPQIDTTAPLVTSVVESPSNGDVDAGKTVSITLNLSEAVTVTGTPTLTLNDGGTAIYSGGSGTNALTFNYMVSASDSNVSTLAITQIKEPSGATITDSAGNAANLSLSGLTQSGPQIDTTALTAPVIANDVINTNDSITLTGTAQDKTTIHVWNGSTELGATTANANGAWSFTTGELTAGSYTFTATATATGPNGVTSPMSAGFDPTIGAPAAPAIVSFSPDSGPAAEDLTNASILTLTGTAGANSTVAVFDGSTELGTTTANGSGQWNYATGALANGEHSFTATEIIGLNVSAPSADLKVTVDTVPPTPPVIVNDVSNTNNSVTLSGTAEADSTVTVYDGTTELGTATVGGAGTWTYTSGTLADGAHSFTATDTDLASSVSSASAVLSVTVGTTPPGAPIIVHDTINANSTITLGGTAAANSTLEVFDGSIELGTTTVDGSGVWNYTTGKLASGNHTIFATDTVDGDASPLSAALSLTLEPTNSAPGTNAGPSPGDARSHNGHFSGRGLNGHGAKPISSAMLDSIFGTSGTSDSHHAADSSDQTSLTTNATSHPSGGFDATSPPLSPDDSAQFAAADNNAVASNHNHHVDSASAPTGGQTESSAVEWAPPPWQTGATAHLDLEIASHHDSSRLHFETNSAGNQSQTTSEMPTESVGSTANDAPSADPSPSIGAHDTSFHFAGFAPGTADAFVFSSDLGNEPIRSPDFTLDQINPHELFEHFIEIHADLHAAAVDNIGELSDSTTSHPNIVQGHNFHIG